MCNPAIAYAVAAVAAAGGAVASADAQRRASHQAQQAPPPPPSPTAEAIINPSDSTSNPSALAAVKRKDLRVDLKTPGASRGSVGAGLMVPVSG